MSDTGRAGEHGVTFISPVKSFCFCLDSCCARGRGQAPPLRGNAGDGAVGAALAAARYIQYFGETELFRGLPLLQRLVRADRPLLRFVRDFGETAVAFDH